MQTEESKYRMFLMEHEARACQDNLPQPSSARLCVCVCVCAYVCVRMCVCTLHLRSPDHTPYVTREDKRGQEKRSCARAAAAYTEAHRYQRMGGVGEGITLQRRRLSRCVVDATW